MNGTLGTIERRRQIAAALCAVGLFNLTVLLAPDALQQGLTTEMIVASLPLAVGIAWLFPVEVVLVFAAATMFRVHEAYPFLMPYRIPFLTSILVVSAASLHAVAGSIALAWRPELKLGLLFCAHVSYGMFFGINRANSMEHWPEFGKLIAGMLFLAMFLRLPRDATRIAAVLIATGTLVGLVAVYNQINGIDLVEGNRVSIGREFNSLLGDPNDLCFILMFPLAFTLSALFLREAPGGLKAACLIALVIMLWAIIATKSRGGLLATVVMTGFLFGVLRKAGRMPIVLILLAGVALYFAAGLGSRSYEFSAGGGIDTSSLGRIEAWKAAIRMAFAYPVFGVGFQNFKQLYWSYTDFWDGKAYVTHSIWFQVLSETGWIGFGLFMAMLVAATRSSLICMRVLQQNRGSGQIKALSAAIVASWIGICVAGSFLSQAFSWQIFALLAFTAVLSQHVQETFPEAFKPAEGRGPKQASAART